jgi:hypothetical protein
MSQLERVRSKLQTDGTISRNYCLDLPYEKKITRLGAIINQLKNMGYAIKGRKEGNDYVYTLTATPYQEIPKKVEYEKVYRNGEWIMTKKTTPLAQN